MKETKVAPYDDDQAFVILTISRNEVRDMCGRATGDRLTDKDMQRLAEELAESYVAGSFVDDLRTIVEDKFLAEVASNNATQM